ncbi:hypothetical protein PENSPDRAFT_753807 [Peniophora sp. CONT]|nr:hypothetical protein PENSPDRAFT_753807 [Peniophora sp. CONT]
MQLFPGPYIKVLPDETLALILALAWAEETDPRCRATFMLVCRQFSEVAVSMPSLWTTVWEKTPVDIVPVYVRRARSRAISLRLDLYPIDSVQSAKAKLGYIEDRLFQLWVCGHVKNISAFFSTCPLPSLTQAEIGQTCSDGCASKQLPKKSFENSRRLKTLTMADDLYLARRTILPASLSSLCIRRVPKLNALLHALLETRNLEHLSIGHSESFSGLDTPKDVPLRYLRKLEVSLDAGGAVAALFESISFPSSTQVNVGLFVTRNGVESLAADIQAACQCLRSLPAPLLGIEAIADGRHHKRGSLAIRCFQNIRTDATSVGCSHIFSIDMWWREGPWPILNRETAYRCILETLPLDHVREVSLCWKGPAFTVNGKRERQHLGLACVPMEIPHVSTLLLSNPMESGLDAVSNLPVLKRIVASAHEWHTLDPADLGITFGWRRDSGHPDVTIDLVDTVGGFHGDVSERIAGFSYIGDEVQYDSDHP